MSDRTQILRVIENMKRAVTMPMVWQMLNEVISLKEDEIWLAFTEAKVKGQWGEVIVTNQHLILLSEYKVIATLPHAAIDGISIVPQGNRYVMGFFYNMGDFQGEVVLPTKEQAEALFELIAEARGTWPCTWPQVYLPEPDSEKISVPLEPPYVTLAKKPKKDIINGQGALKFPYRCTWCGSEHVTAARQVRLYMPNPRYTSGLGRALKQGVGLAVGGVVGGAILGPAEWEKIKGVALNITVPHCANHVDTPIEEAMSLISAGLDGSSPGLIQVRSTEYAQATSQANMGQPTPWEAPLVEEVVNQTEQILSGGKLYLPRLRGLIWPQQCVVCGEQEASEHYQPEITVQGSVKLEGESIDVPICTDDLKKFNRSTTISCLVMLIGAPIAVGLLWLTLILFGGDGSGLLRWGTAILVGIMSYALWVFVLNRIAASKLSVDDLDWKPISITLKDGHYLLEFYNEKMAKTVRQANNLTEAT